MQAHRPMGLLTFKAFSHLKRWCRHADTPENHMFFCYLCMILQNKLIGNRIAAIYVSVKE